MRSTKSIWSWIKVCQGNQILDFAIAAAREAGLLARKARASRTFRIDEKGRFDLVTGVDTDIDNHLRNRISAAWPAHHVLSEEGDRNQSYSTQAHTWIIDPLDGTTNFVRGLDHLAISIAFVVADVTQVGVVHAPFLNETFWAVRGNGAWRNGTRIRAESDASLARAAIATGFPHDRSQIEGKVEQLRRLLGACGSVRILGAPALDICWVADARLSGVFDRLFIWDVAAAALIALEAGARVTELSSKFPNGRDYLISSNDIHEDLQRIIDDL